MYQFQCSVYVQYVSSKICKMGDNRGFNVDHSSLKCQMIASALNVIQMLMKRLCHCWVIILNGGETFESFYQPFVNPCINLAPAPHWEWCRKWKNANEAAQKMSSMYLAEKVGRSTFQGIWKAMKLSAFLLILQMMIPEIFK